MSNRPRTGSVSRPPPPSLFPLKDNCTPCCLALASRPCPKPGPVSPWQFPMTFQRILLLLKRKPGTPADTAWKCVPIPPTLKIRKAFLSCALEVKDQKTTNHLLVTKSNGQLGRLCPDTDLAASSCLPNPHRGFHPLLLFLLCGLLSPLSAL